MRAAAAVFRRDLALAFRQGGGGAVALSFFLVTAATAPLALGGARDVLGPIAPGFIWTAAALAALLSLERFFQSDYEEGGLEVLALSPAPLEIVAAAKAGAFWCAALLPLIAASPVIAILLQMDAAAIAPLMVALLLGAPALSLIGAAAAALAVGVRRGGLLIALMALPLYAPVLIFGAGAVNVAPEAGLASAPMLFLAAYSLFCLAACPVAAGAALRLNLE